MFIFHIQLHGEGTDSVVYSGGLGSTLVHVVYWAGYFDHSTGGGGGSECGGDLTGVAYL